MENWIDNLAQAYVNSKDDKIVMTITFISVLFLIIILIDYIVKCCVYKDIGIYYGVKDLYYLWIPFIRYYKIGQISDSAYEKVRLKKSYLRVLLPIFGALFVLVKTLLFVGLIRNDLNAVRYMAYIKNWCPIIVIDLIFWALNIMAVYNIINSISSKNIVLDILLSIWSSITLMGVPIMLELGVKAEYKHEILLKGRSIQKDTCTIAVK